MSTSTMHTTSTPRRLSALGVAFLGTGAILALTLLIKQQTNEEVGRYFLYQVIALLVAVAVVQVVRLITGAGLPRWGDLSAPSRRMRLLGVAEGESWKRIGVTFAIIISAVTALFLGIGYWDQITQLRWGAWAIAFIIAIPLSMTNALTEELITRWAIVAAFSGLWARYAPWASALLFGGVHWFGIPGGPIGALMAGFLAWLLTRSIQDTKGIGWAWIIHFCQDMLIFTVTIALFV